MWFRCFSALCGREQLQRKGDIGDGFELVADPTGVREDVVSTDLSAGDELFCLFEWEENIEQTMPVKVAEFAFLLMDKLNAAESVYLQIGFWQAQHFRFQ